MKNNRSSIVLTSICLLSWMAPSVSYGKPESKAETNWMTTVKPLPLTTGIRLDDNIYRDTGDDPKTDEIAYFGGGLILGSSLKESWRGEAQYQCFADLYRNHEDLNNFRNHLSLVLSTAPRPLQASLEKQYIIRRSRETNYDYWDDRSGFGLFWNATASWNMGLQFENSLRRYYDDALVVQARNFNDNTMAMNVIRQLEEHLSIQLGGVYGRREFNRYAVRQEADEFRILGETQKDDLLGAQMGLHWYLSAVLNDLTLQIQSTRSNNHGSSHHVRSISWAAGTNPVPALTLQVIFRLYRKKYDVDPLTLPEFQLGFNEEDDQDLLSARITWALGHSWEAGLGYSRMRTESAIPAKYYLKHLFLLQLQRRFP